MTKNIKLPQPAEKPIEAVLEEFLADQRARLKPKTLSKYQDVIRLFKDCMDILLSPRIGPPFRILNALPDHAEVRSHTQHADRRRPSAPGWCANPSSQRVSVVSLCSNAA